MLRPSKMSDLPFVLTAERQAHDHGYVGQWSYAQHQEAITGADKAHFIVTGAEKRDRVGYVILEGLTDANQCILLRRIVITQQDQGYGRTTLRTLKHLVFDTYGAHRFWLDVKAFNPRARHLYETEGFVLEGCLREALKLQESYHSMYVMSLLRSEYEAHQPQDR